MLKKNQAILENSQLNDNIKSNALYDIWQLLTKIEPKNLPEFERALLNCAMARAWEARSIDFAV